MSRVEAYPFSAIPETTTKPAQKRRNYKHMLLAIRGCRGLETYQNPSPKIVPLGFFDLEGLVKRLFLVEFAISIHQRAILQRLRRLLRRWRGRLLLQRRLVPIIGL